MNSYNRWKLGRRLSCLPRLCGVLTAMALAGCGTDDEVAAQAVHAPSKFVVATYRYPDVDREAAVAPFAGLIESIAGQTVEIRVAETPTELADWMTTGEAQFAVPNLVGYLLMKTGSASVTELAVPVSQTATDDEGDAYTSSLIVSGDSSFTLISGLREIDTPQTVFMVWPDSASGALVASARLRQELKEDFDGLDIEFAGSHQNVLDKTAGTSGSAGVLATKVYLDYLSSAEFPAVREIWRSEPIPFGPLVCQASVSELCDRIRNRLLEGSAESVGVLEALQGGWPEFSGATGFSQAGVDEYRPLIDAFASGQKNH